jgi:HptB-dependent secretion and biofilm anti anti-sigma factor
MRLLKNKSQDGNEITISLPEKFDFQLHKEFRQAYEEADAKSLVLDMNKTQYMDSSALGMLLQLKEYSDNNNSKICIKNASNNIMQIMQIAHFDKLFTIA